MADELRLPQPYAGKAGSLRQLIGWLTGEIGLLDEVIADFLGSWPYRRSPVGGGMQNQSIWC